MNELPTRNETADVQWCGSTIDNVNASIWVADPMVEQVNDTEAMRDTDVGRVCSVEGVSWATPFYQGNRRTRMRDGSFKKPDVLLHGGGRKDDSLMAQAAVLQRTYRISPTPQ